ncbi:Lrp/AsnC family transcriptional regulator [Arthrobacter woluwensis]|uniref:Lrp/AsnC family transcriptional regulator n=1 Tax=Arthrobacter woluwensis TaxID=156980 RepID=UPI001AB00842|nr:Lrp/AsnC family transcriptional regulator [Arthrobacter woluwensis]QTF70934.1 Lrp/AsnC family transcriptional regulator [Arthrobacter woluwensis]
MADWHPGPITATEVEALQETAPPRTRPVGGAVLDEVDQTLVSLLVEDGRVPTSELGEAVSLSAPAVRRRLTALLEDGALSVRAIVEPVDIGLPVEAVIWMRTAPTAVAEVGHLVSAEPGVRYAAMTMGEFQLMVNVTLAGLDDLRRFITASEWASRVLAMRTSVVVGSYKRGGRARHPLTASSQLNHPSLGRSEGPSGLNCDRRAA